MGGKAFIIVILIIYMYGAMSLKYVSGAESFIEAIGFIISGEDKDACYLYKSMGSGAYYIGILVFAVLSLSFSFGNIENAKIL